MHRSHSGKKRKEIETFYLAEMGERFKKQRVIPIPLMEVEIDEKTLEQMANWLKPLLEVDDELKARGVTSGE